MRRVTARRRVLIAGLMAGAAGCTPFRDAPPAVDVRAVETQSGQTVAPDDPYYQAAVRAISLRDYARALDYLQTARQKQPDDVRVLNAFGVVYDKLGRFDLSARYYSDAKKLDPASPIIAANQAYSAVLEAREYGTVVPFEMANAAQSLPVGDSRMPPATIVSVLGPEPANPPSPAAQAQVTRAPAVLPGLPDTAQPAAAAVADARAPNSSAVPAPAPVVPSADKAVPPSPAVVGPSLAPTEAPPSITIPGTIAPSQTAVIAEPPVPAANAVEPPVSPVVASSAPIATTSALISAAAVPVNTTSIVSHAPSPVAVNSAPPVVAEPPNRPEIVTPSISSPASISAVPAQFASPLVPAAPSIVSLAPAEEPTDSHSAGSGTAKASAPNFVPAPRASSAQKFDGVLPSVQPSVVALVPPKEFASESVGSAATKAPASNASPHAQADSSVRTRTARALPRVTSPSVVRVASTDARHSGTEAIAAMPARTKHTKSAASNSPIARIASGGVHPAPSTPSGSRTAVASAVIHASSGTRTGMKAVTAQRAPLSKKLVLIGKPLFIINGSGRSGASEPVRQRLASLRWTAPSWAVSDGAQQSVTTIRYAPIYFIVAHALARTLPFPSRLVACDKQCGGVSLILGRDFLKARLVKTAAATTRRS